MFCLNEEDEEDDPLQPISGNDFLLTLFENFLPSKVTFPEACF